ncbi:substrate-binding domain-containing protein [Youngiibacter multivorans]|uniref:Tungstate transport system substrate-binding protein n=1 Tax=Youngiibacter multivorans TaxID=937251 RepID=A0ABS4G2V7_9CLOT|nr:substrate-binding domain-containing protein [Youngiibacter multivorans]MBP1918878.1 tungstate transport system substrate-binding protein [Youngiibacter multivorans]
MQNLKAVKGTILISFALTAVMLLSACAKTPAAPTEPAKSTFSDTKIILSTTTSVNDSGLLEYLLPFLKEDTGIQVDVLSQGTGQAIQTAVDGNADVILVHSKAAEETFVKDGFGVERIEFMYNFFVVVGPKDDPAKIKGAGLTASEAFKKVMEAKATFLSRGDKSGTHNKELALWKTAGIEPAGDWYVAAGKGMGALLTMTSEMKGYTLTDKATYLSMKDQLDLEIVLEESADLKNQYSVIAVNPDKHPDTNTEAVDIFIEWLTSDKILDLIEGYGKDKYGEGLFLINFAK